MKTILFSIFSGLVLLASQIFANATGTTVSDIKDANVVCFHISKSEALVFKTSLPQKVWKTLQDREGKIKNYKALQLALVNMNLTKDIRSVESFKANITEGYQLDGFFESQDDGELSLSVTSTYIPDNGQSNIIDQYNCSKM